MKKRIYISLIIVVLLACTEDVEMKDSNISLSVTATTEDFVPLDETVTRASENLYKTDFVNGDQIGITVVKDGKIVDGIKNICYTYNSATKKWETVGDTPPLHIYQDVTYLAYYPYDAVTMADKLSEEEILHAFVPQTDQSTYANYTKSDLMVATGTADRVTKTLSLSFRHMMAMLSVSVFTNKFITPNGYEYTPGEDFAVRNLTETAITVGEDTFSPCSFNDGTFRIIVAPDAVAKTVDIKYRWVDLVDFTDTKQHRLIAGKYLYYSFKMPESVPYVRAVAAGDYFYRDGKILPKEALVIRDPKNCVGVLLDAASGSDAGYGGNCEGNTIHGHVFALYNAAYCKWGPNGNIGTNTSDSWNDWRGYLLTQNMKNDADNKYGGLSASNYAAAYYCLNYGNTEEGKLETTKTSGWYFPSEGFMFRLEGFMLGTVRSSLSKLAVLGCGADFTNSYYWDSSTANSDATARRVNILRGGTGAMGAIASRSSSNYVRAVLTF